MSLANITDIVSSLLHHMQKMVVNVESIESVKEEMVKMNGKLDGINESLIKLVKLMEENSETKRVS